MCHAIYQHTKVNNKYMRDYETNKELSYFMDWDVNNFYEWAISKKLPVNGFEWKKGTIRFDEDFMRKYDKDGDIWYILENIRNYRDVKPVNTMEWRRSYFESEPNNWLTAKCPSKNLLAIKMKGTKVTVNKPVIMHVSILDMS